MAENRLSKKWRKVVTAVAGGSVVVFGLIAIPAPGPGFLIIFAGLSILSREYAWAARLLRYGQAEYVKWESWLKRQNPFTKGLLSIIAVCIFVSLLWISNTLYILASLLGIAQDWLESPLFK